MAASPVRMPDVAVFSTVPLPIGEAAGAGAAALGVEQDEKNSGAASSVVAAISLTGDGIFMMMLKKQQLGGVSNF